MSLIDKGGVYVSTHFLKRTIVFLLIAVILLVVANMTVIFLGMKMLGHEHVIERYFGMTDDERIVPMKPLPEDMGKTKAVDNWLANAITHTYKWTFRDRIEHTKEICHRYFTDRGCNTYKESLVKFGVVEYVEKNKLLVSAIVERTPVIVKHGPYEAMDSDVNVWVLELVARVTYESSTKGKPQRELITAYVINDETKTGGYAIDAFISEKRYGD